MPANPRPSLKFTRSPFHTRLHRDSGRLLRAFELWGGGRTGVSCSKYTRIKFTTQSGRYVAFFVGKVTASNKFYNGWFFCCSPKTCNIQWILTNTASLVSFLCVLFRLRIFSGTSGLHGTFSDSLYRHAGIQGVGCFIFFKVYILTFILLTSRTANSVLRPIIFHRGIFIRTSVFVGWLGVARWECTFAALHRVHCVLWLYMGLTVFEHTFNSRIGFFVGWDAKRGAITPFPGLNISCITFFCEILNSYPSLAVLLDVTATKKQFAFVSCAFFKYSLPFKGIRKWHFVLIPNFILMNSRRNKLTDHFCVSKPFCGTP